MRFVKIDQDNYREIIGLTVFDNQEEFVMSNVKAMAAAYAYGDLVKAYGVENDGYLVGMVMLREYPPNNEYFLWHMMIDKKYQNLGIGKLAVEEVIRIAKEEGLGLVTTCCAGNEVALKLYQSYGFEVFQAYEDEEIDLRLTM